MLADLCALPSTCHMCRRLDVSLPDRHCRLWGCAAASTLHRNQRRQCSALHRLRAHVGSFGIIRLEQRGASRGACEKHVSGDNLCGRWVENVLSIPDVVQDRDGARLTYLTPSSEGAPLGLSAPPSSRDCRFFSRLTCTMCSQRKVLSRISSTPGTHARPRTLLPRKTM